MVPKARKKQHRKNNRFFNNFFTKIASKWEPKIDEKSIKMGDHFWVRALLETKVTPKIDFVRSKPDFEPPEGHFRALWINFGPTNV